MSRQLDRPSGADFVSWAEEKLAEYTERRKQMIERGGASAPAITAGLLPARNKPCPCGSGRKYKHCCRVHHPYVGVAAPAVGSDNVPL